MIWIDFKKQQPTERGYYYIKYLHKDGNTFQKAIWWNGKNFGYKDYVAEVLAYLSKRFDFYVPCMIWAESFLISNYLENPIKFEMKGVDGEQS